MCGSSCCGATMCDKSDQAVVSKKIENDIKRAKKKNYVNLLLLGTGGAGKTTFLNQMEILHGEGFTDPTRAAKFTEIIFYNIYESVKHLTFHMDRLQMRYTNELNQIYLDRIRRSGYDHVVTTSAAGRTVLSTEFSQMARSIWEDENVVACFDRRAEFLDHTVEDNLPYFMTHLDRISHPEYVPTQQDILNSRRRTRNTCYKELELMKCVIFRVTDVSGQRQYRRVWLDLLHDAVVVIFLASMSDYDQGLPEEPEVNSFVESIAVFRRLIELTPKKTVILYLNKEDLLRKKLPTSPFEKTHPKYDPNQNYHTEPSSDEIDPVENVKRFMEKQFLDVWNEVKSAEAAESPGSPSEKTPPVDEEAVTRLYTQFMSANDTDIVKTIFQKTKNVIFEAAIRSLVLL